LKLCDVDIDRSPNFKRNLQALQLKHPRVIIDLREAFDRIEQAPTAACSARRMQLGTNHEVYKYRCKSSDAQKGSNKAYRIIALYERQMNLLTPLALYLKSDAEDIPAKEVLAAIAALT
jgi:hypothetical protein